MAAAPIGLTDWIQTAKVSLTKEDYVKCALTVASELTKFLNLVVVVVDGPDNNGHHSLSSIDFNASIEFNAGITSNMPWHDSSDLVFDLLSEEVEVDDERGVSSPNPNATSTIKGPDFPLFNELSQGNNITNNNVDAPTKGTNATATDLVHQLSDIVTKNVLVSIPLIDLTKDFDENPCANFEAKEVKLKKPSSVQSDISGGGTQKISSREVCFALGKILFEIFSQGNNPESLIDDCCNDETNDDDSFGDFIDLALGGLDQEDSAEDTSDQQNNASRKRANVNNSSDNGAQNGNNNKSQQLTSAMKAKSFLQEQGLPVSICLLVSDLLEAWEGNPFIPDAALTSLDEVNSDLKQMQSYPERFLCDKTCPNEALNDTDLFNTDGGGDRVVYGRDTEIGELMGIVNRVSMHATAPNGDVGNGNGGSLLCEAAFLSGYSGCGKSLITKQLVLHCQRNNWTVVACKFDRQIAPLSILLKSLDAAFARFLPLHEYGGYLQKDSSLQQTFDKISQSIISRVDSESFGQLCQLLPVLRKLFPIALQYVEQGESEIESSDQFLMSIVNQTNSSGMGSGRNRLHHLVSIVFTALCSGGHPVLLVLEDLQWADNTTINIIQQSTNYATQGEESVQGGLFYLGNYRDNEVDEKGFLMQHINGINQSRIISIGELAQHDINVMLSVKFCLPSRHTKQIAELVFSKTRGNPLFCIEFLKSIIERNFITYSVKSRRWVWDDVAIDTQQISEGVVFLLSKKLKQLPEDVIEALKVASCFGHHINISTIQRLGQWWPNMSEALERAVEEGIMEKSGALFVFSHDMIQETTYDLIPVDERKPLHKKIGMGLSQDAECEQFRTLAADQINRCQADLPFMLSHDAKDTFARLNLASGEQSLCASSYEQARGYFEAGISLVQSINGHWDTMYDLSLRLYEMSSVVSFMDGGEANESRLNEVIANAKCFDHSLNARAMLAQLYVSQGKIAQGVQCLLAILSHLGEDFPGEIDHSMLMAEIGATRAKMNGIKKETIMNLPALDDGQKKQAMKYMKMLLHCSLFFSPTMNVYLSCRMLNHTFSYGYCEESIQAMATFSQGLVRECSDYDLAKQINRVTGFLMKESPNEHLLRAQSTIMLTGVNTIVEPQQAVLENLANAYQSALIVGDLDNKHTNMVAHSIGSVHATADLKSSQKTMLSFMYDMSNHKRLGMLHNTMSCFNVCTAFIGNEDSCMPGSIEISTNDDLETIAENTQNSWLMHYVLINKIYTLFYFRQHLAVTKVAEKYEATQKGKRALDFIPKYYQGLSALCLARKTKDSKWRDIGEEAVKSHALFAKHGTWNFEHKHLLLQAELYFLDQRHSMAELFYKSAILSARDHKIIQEEALACELYGIYFIENKRVAEGVEQLQTAVKKYQQWGALKKSLDVIEFAAEALGTNS